MRRYAVLGAGMQGTAAAYDIARFGEPEGLVLADVRPEAARSAAERVNQLVGTNAARWASADATDPASLRALLADADVLVSAVPYTLQPNVWEAAFDSRTSMVDMGNDTTDTLRLLERDAEAKALGIALVPDTGLAPGLVNSLGNLFLERLDEADAIRLYCGGLPQNHKPPFGYKLVFSVEGLVGEYTDETLALRNGEVVAIETLDELEELDVEGLGRMEAFTTSGGASTAPFTHRGRVRNYEYKTVRYPGHCALMRVFRDCGFWGTEPVQAGGAAVRPRDLFCALMRSVLEDPEDRDLVVVRAVGEGRAAGRRVRLQADILDRHDEATGFSAMERLTGFSSSIVAIEIARGAIGPGCHAYETAMTGERFVREIRRRGIVVDVREEALD
ncbi:MAG: saccharopine dehydrogenase NADP-binding domain-containing protein [Fimbriimonadales bacterium]|nr:saccharopine dehydrogenase NADP-binding domain-containing protein [Fimbriimonadales bacterium]